MDNQILLETYSANAKAFLAAAREISAEKALLSPGADEWPASYIIHHMADSEIQFGVRYADLLSEDIPDIVPFDEAKFPAGLHYELRSIQNSLMAFEATNRLNCEILSNTSAEDWNRTALHPERGLVTLIDLVTLCGNHIGDHIAQMQRAAL